MILSASDEQVAHYQEEGVLNNREAAYFFDKTWQDVLRVGGYRGSGGEGRRGVK
jgi:hypothetical protein